MVQVFYELDSEHGPLELVVKPSFQGEPVRIRKLMYAVTMARVLAL